MYVCMCGSRIEKEKGVEERKRKRLCECVVRLAKQKKERGSVCVYV
jgi:hypothetical protein